MIRICLGSGTGKPASLALVAHRLPKYHHRLAAWPGRPARVLLLRPTAGTLLHSEGKLLGADTSWRSARGGGDCLGCPPSTT